MLFEDEIDLKELSKKYPENLTKKSFSKCFLISDEYVQIEIQFEFRIDQRSIQQLDR